MKVRFFKGVALCVCLGASSAHSQDAAVVQTPTATAETAIVNREVSERLGLGDRQDFEDAERNLLGRIGGDNILREDGAIGVRIAGQEFLDGPAPDSVNPSLWRQGQLNRIHGLFQVVDGVYQLRAYDAANMTLVEGETGWIIVDPLSTPAPVRAGLNLADQLLGERPVSAIIFTHNHRDHLGGVRGALDRAIENVPIYAPTDFYSEFVSENVLAGPAMNRRSLHQLGATIPRGPTGWVSFGLAQRISRGTPELVRPTQELATDTQTLVIDGVPFIFFDANGTEATSEFVFYLTEQRTVHGAEVVTGNQHNVLTPRGAQVRDTLRWSQVIDRLLFQAEDDAQVLIASHHGPVFGHERVEARLRNHRNLYRYLHDQTLRRANLGMTMHEIANDIPEPQLMQRDLSTRPLYGDYRHNIRAVYQRYFGWWDGVAANLDPYDPIEMSRRYVDAMGGASHAVEIARSAFEAGDYRWAAAVYNHVVFSDPAHQDARNGLIRAYRQLGFQQESGIFRNIYLNSAADLETPSSFISSRNQRVDHYPLIDQANVLAIRFNPDNFTHTPFRMNVRWSDSDELVALDVDSDVLFPRSGSFAEAEFDLELSRNDWRAIIYEGAAVETVITDTPTAIAISALIAALDTAGPQFNISEP